jgi:hypothetical protein
MLLRYFKILSTFFIVGCGQQGGTEGTEVASQCVQQELGMVCPLGTSPKLSASAMSSCNQETDFSASASYDPAAETSGSGSYSNSSICVGSGDCFIECEIVAQCEYGYEIFTREMITCASAPEDMGEQN